MGQKPRCGDNPYRFDQLSDVKHGQHRRNSMKLKIDRFRDTLFDHLFDITHRILTDYRLVISDMPIDDVKRFAACHLAGRSALLHLQELLRLAEGLATSDGEYGTSFCESDLDKLLTEASAAVRELRGDEGLP